MTAIVMGIAGPLLVTVVSWVLAARTYRRNPVALTSLMIAAFGAKLLFFAVYVVLGLKAMRLEPTAFIGSLAASFIVFHMIEALCLKQLFSEGAR